MNNNISYLKPNIVLEPLFDLWYAWSHLISPATAARNITGRHLKIMNSYIQAPEIHAAAVKDPKMLGGPFMDYDRNRVDDVRTLKQHILNEQYKLIELSDALAELDELLSTQAKGFSLEPLYEKVPDCLKGLVELSYDLNNNPSFRLIEPLLYQSEYFSTRSQSIALWETRNDDRPFVLSTPRLMDDDILHINIPFNHPGIDRLSEMKYRAGSIDERAKDLGVTEKQFPLFKSFFTTEAPKPYQKYTGDKIRMRYFGHACILIETSKLSILVDPLVSYYGYQSDTSRFSDLDLPERIDYVMITHNHQDHILFETLLPLRHRINKLIVPKSYTGTLQDPNLKLMFDHIGFENVIEIGEMESVRDEECVITGIPFTGEHSDLNIGSKLCYYIEISDFKVLFVADSRIMEPRIYDYVAKQKGDVDVLFLGMECDGAPLTWLYGPLLNYDLDRGKDQSRRLAGSNFAKGIHLVDIFNPIEVYVYAMGQEPWVKFISSVKYTDESNPIIQSNKLIDECRSRGIVAERLFGEKELFYEINEKFKSRLEHLNLDKN